MSTYLNISHIKLNTCSKMFSVYLYLCFPWPHSICCIHAALKHCFTSHILNIGQLSLLLIFYSAYQFYRDPFKFIISDLSLMLTFYVPEGFFRPGGLHPTNIGDVLNSQYEIKASHSWGGNMTKERGLQRRRRCRRLFCQGET